MIRRRIVLRDMTDDERRAWAGTVAVALDRSGAFIKPSLWPLAIFVAEPGKRPRVTSRGDFVGYLRAAGLTDQASEVARRRVRPRELLAWITLEDEVIFATLQLDRGVWS